MELELAREKHELDVEMKEKQLDLQKKQDEMEIAKAERFLQIQKEMKKYGISSISTNQVSYDTVCYLWCRSRNNITRSNAFAILHL